MPTLRSIKTFIGGYFYPSNNSRKSKKSFRNRKRRNKTRR